MANQSNVSAFVQTSTSNEPVADLARHSAHTARNPSQSSPYASRFPTSHSHSASVDKEPSSIRGLHLRSASLPWTQQQLEEKQQQQQPSASRDPVHAIGGATSPPLSPASPAPADDFHMVDVALNTPQDGVRGFYERNRGLAYVLLAQVFGVLMNVTTRLLEVEGNRGAGMHPFQILFVRMVITTTLSVAYMHYSKTPHFPFGLREVRWLLMLRGIGGFFGVFGMYCMPILLPCPAPRSLT